jgi:hypothetical protein
LLLPALRFLCGASGVCRFEVRYRGNSPGSCESCSMPRRPFLRHVNDATVYLVVNDFGQFGRAFVEADVAEADRETIIGKFLAGQYSDAIRVVAFNTAEGWSWDASQDIAREVLQRSVDADQVLGENTQYFIHRHIADPAKAAPKAPTLKRDSEKRPPAPSVQRGPTYQVNRRPGDEDPTPASISDARGREAHVGCCPHLIRRTKSNRKCDLFVPSRAKAPAGASVGHCGGRGQRERPSCGDRTIAPQSQLPPRPIVPGSAFPTASFRGTCHFFQLIPEFHHA